MKRAPSLFVLLLNLMLVAVTVLSGVVASEWLTRLTDFGWLMADPNRAGRIVVGVLLLILFSFAGMPLFTLGFAARDFHRGFRWQAFLSGGISAALILILALWIGFGGAFASYKEAQVGRAWAATLDPIDTFTSRYPEGPASGGALRLEAAGARIGIDLIPYGVLGTRAAESDRRSYEVVREKLLAFVSSETDKATAMLDAPPVEVAPWLSAHSAGVTALVGEALQGGPIVFETHWSTYDRLPVSLTGLRGVVSVLILHGLEKERVGDSRAALDALEASWRFGDALRDRGELISQISALGLDGMTLGALRKVNDVPQPWQARIAEHDYLISMLRALEGEAWRTSAMINGLFVMGHPAGERPWHPLESPYMRLMASNYSEAVRKMVAGVKGSDPCSVDPSALERRTEGSIARWNTLGRIAIPSLSRAWWSAVGMALGAELTQKVLAARTLKQTRGNWPVELPGLSSAVCPGVAWIYSTSNDGSVSLALSQKPTYGPSLAFRSLRPAQSRSRLTPLPQARLP